MEAKFLWTAGGLAVAALFGIGWASARVFRTIDDFGRKDPPVLAVLASQTLRDGRQLRLVRAESREVPGGSALVIPLLPVVIARKETFVRHFLELVDPAGQSLWKSGFLADAPKTDRPLASVAELKIENAVDSMVLNLAPGPGARLELFGPVPLAADQIATFIRAHAEDIGKVAGAPVTEIAHYRRREPCVFSPPAPGGAADGGPRPHLTMSGGALSVFVMPGDRAALGNKYQLSLQMPVKAGRVDLSAAPEWYDGTTAAQKDFLMKAYGELDRYKDDEGKTVKDVVELANRAYARARNRATDAP